MADEEEYDEDEMQDEELEDFDDDLSDDLDPEDVADDDFDDLEGGGGGSTAGLDAEAPAEEAVKANPKRITAAQRKKNKAIVEGIVDAAYFETPEGTQKVYEQLKEETDPKAAKKYSIKAELTENDIVDHPKFGLGFVLELLTPTKVDVLFEDGRRKLVHSQK